MMKNIETIGAWIRRLLFPRRCAACSALLDWYEIEKPPLCDACLALWERETRKECEICAKPIARCDCMTESMKKAGCAGFRKLVYYRHGKRSEVQNRVIYRIKNTRDVETARFLAARLLRECEQELAPAELSDRVCLTYVPRATRTKLETGTDQARELAEALGHLSGIPMERLIRRRKHHRAPQKKLSARERLRNAEQTFCLCRNADVKGKNVILVDDIVTTGSTVATCVKLLRKGGAARVFCLSVATNELHH